MTRATTLSLLLAVVVVAPVAAQTKAESSCVACHRGINEQILQGWARDVHLEVGLGCTACHGGDPSPALAEDADAAKAAAKGFRSAPDRFQIARFCGDCHADAEFMKQYNPRGRVDQLAEYRTSIHGRRNSEGDPKPATCTDCHGVHGIRRASSPDSPVYAANVPEMCAKCHEDAALMEAYGIPTDQLEDYRRSVHGAALLERQDTAAPACNDCHGNHGAAPPGVESVANVCGQCHGREGQLFRASFKKELFDGMDMAECSVCHGNHHIVHPTPESFRSGAAPRLSHGSVVGFDPFVADLGQLEEGQPAEVEWTVVLNPYLAADDPRLDYRVTLSAEGSDPVSLDATVRPGGDDEALRPRETASDRLAASLTVAPLSGRPVKAGDALRLGLTIRATGGPLPGLRVQTERALGVDVVQGSVCLTCHSLGDACDVATEKMYEALSAVDAELRDAERVLHRAEVAGMDVGEVQFELNSRGVTAALDARALIHTFEPERLIERTGEAREVAATALDAGRAALAEIAYRRRGLAISLVLIGLVLVGLFFKIREIDRRRRASVPSR